MTIEEAVELYNKKKAEIAEIDHVMKTIVARYKESAHSMKRFELTDDEFSIIAGYVNELKLIKNGELKQQFKIEGCENIDH